MKQKNVKEKSPLSGILRIKNLHHTCCITYIVLYPHSSQSLPVNHSHAGVIGRGERPEAVAPGQAE